MQLYMLTIVYRNLLAIPLFHNPEDAHWVKIWLQTELLLRWRNIQDLAAISVNLFSCLSLTTRTLVRTKRRNMWMKQCGHQRRSTQSSGLVRSFCC